MSKAFKYQLREWEKRHLRGKDYANKKDRRMKARKGKSEHFTRREIEDLMGTNRPIYERHRGAFRQK
ncbi:hypothetical protein [Heyndrickxia coagulans]|uniref:hypothetical protein n=1 Tax=Heyndrickxia coagulans TaxID=1398 RepID=UPI002E21F5EF|nr:hypothetical protein [Heyndrickxia coagulans]